MTTIAIDSETKNRAAKRAKKDHLSLSAATRILLNDYAEGKIEIKTHVVTIEDDRPTKAEIDEMLQESMESIKDRENLSPDLSSDEDIEDYLLKL